MSCRRRWAPGGRRPLRRRPTVDPVQGPASAFRSGRCRPCGVPRRDDRVTPDLTQRGRKFSRWRSLLARPCGEPSVQERPKVAYPGSRSRSSLCPHDRLTVLVVPNRLLRSDFLRSRLNKTPESGLPIRIRVVALAGTVPEEFPLPRPRSEGRVVRRAGGGGPEYSLSTYCGGGFTLPGSRGAGRLPRAKPVDSRRSRRPRARLLPPSPDFRIPLLSARSRPPRPESGPSSSRTSAWIRSGGSGSTTTVTPARPPDRRVLLRPNQQAALTGRARLADRRAPLRKTGPRERPRG